MGIASVSWIVGSFEPIQGHVERRVVGELARGCVESEPVPTVILDIHNHLVENLCEFWLAKRVECGTIDVLPTSNLRTSVRQLCA